MSFSKEVLILKALFHWCLSSVRQKQKILAIRSHEPEAVGLLGLIGEAEGGHAPRKVENWLNQFNCFFFGIVKLKLFIAV